MSAQVAIVAIVTPAPGKLERFKEVTAEAIEWIRDNEPGTLQFEMNEAMTDEGAKITLIERYESQEALDRHEGSENYKSFFGKVMEEEMLVGAPQIVRGKAVAGFRRGGFGVT